MSLISLAACVNNYISNHGKPEDSVVSWNSPSV